MMKIEVKKKKKKKKKKKRLEFSTKTLVTLKTLLLYFVCSTTIT